MDRGGGEFVVKSILDDIWQIHSDIEDILQKKKYEKGTRQWRSRSHSGEDKGPSPRRSQSSSGPKVLQGVEPSCVLLDGGEKKEFMMSVV